MNLFKAKHGAVSVFLVIILVPSLIITSLFVDISRMYMGNSVAESASDLALNTKLSQYDKDLNDIYGLFANAESENDVLNNLNDYLSSCMQSAGIEKTDAEKNSEKLSNALSSGNQDSNQVISDLLGIQVDKDNTTIGPVQNANLENPAELERQIVEFMKYRGPIDISKNIVSRFRKIVKKTKNVSKESDITEKMNDYLEEEQSILELLETAYNEGMKPYMTDYNNNKNKISDTETLVNKLKDDYKDYYDTLFKNLENTKETGKFDFSGLDFSNNKNKSEIKHLKTRIDEYEKEINEDNAKQWYDENIDKAKDAINDFKEYLNHIVECGDEFEQKYVKYKNFSYYQKDGLYDVQVYKNIYDKITSKSQFGDLFFKDFKDKANNCIDYYALIYVAHKNTKINDKEFNELTKKYTEVSCKKDSEEYGNAEKFLNSTYITDNNRQIYYQYLYFTPMKNYVKKLVDKVWDKINKKARDELNSKISGTYTKIDSFYNYFDNAKEKIDTAYKKVKKARENYDSSINKKYANWGAALGEIKGKESDVKNQSKSAYDAEKEKGGFQDVVSKEKLQALENRLKSISDLFDEIMNYIDSVKFNGKPIHEIENLKDFDKAAKIDEEKIVVNKATLDSNADQTFKEKIEIPKVTFKINAMNHPDLSKKSNNKTAEQARELYEYCKDKFDLQIAPDDNKKKTKDVYDKMKKNNKDGTEADSDEDEKNYTSDVISKREINQPFTRDNKKSDGKSNGKENKDKTKLSKVGDKIGGIIDGIKEICDDPSNLRDDLYVLDYIMEMFSYHTYNREGVYNIAEKENDSGITNPITVSTYLNKYKDAWTNEENTFTDNKTLTNKMINLKNNYSFGNEVEYILYGGDNDSNKSKVLAKLFLIRYACNLGPEFMENWSVKSTVSQIANGISASFPVIPVFLVKTVLILGLTALETAVDLSYLKLGMKVPIIKSKDELVININLDGSTKKGSSKNTAKGIQYSDYLSIFLFADLVNSNTHNQILTRTSSVIGKNVSVAKNLDTDFEMSKAVTYFELKTKVKVNPLLLKLPLMSDSMNQVNDIDWFSWDFDIIRGYN